MANAVGNVVEMTCTGCGRKYDQGLGIRTRVECSVCGCDFLIPSFPLSIHNPETGKLLETVPGGVPFRCYDLKVPKIAVLCRAERFPFPFSPPPPLPSPFRGPEGSESLVEGEKETEEEQEGLSCETNVKGDNLADPEEEAEEEREKEEESRKPEKLKRAARRTRT